MSFASASYLFFLPAVAVLHGFAGRRFAWIVLFLASCIFYAAFVPKYLLILFAIILTDFTAAIALEHATSRPVRRTLLSLSLALNLGVLVTFKYIDWLLGNVESLLSWAGHPEALPRLALLLPIGLSFHTFQSMAYVLEVYYRRFPAEKHLGHYANYVLFFPQMVAGPIERPQRLLPQLRRGPQFSYEGVTSGLRLILIGYARKCVVADNLGVYVDGVFKNHLGASPCQLLLACVFFTFQIYCDFCGYTEIAQGSAKVLGIELSLNFHSPYLARSVREFWRRWHVSLSSWFRDYVYLPLGGSQRCPWRVIVNLLVVFLMSGLWHGANLTFVAWGALHAAYVAGERAIPAWGRLGRLGHPIVGRVVTFALVAAAWIFFRATSIGQATAIYARIASPSMWDAHQLALEFRRPQVGVGLALASGVLLYEVCVAKFRRFWDSLPRTVRWGVYYSALGLILELGRFEGRQFIYFQF